MQQVRVFDLLTDEERRHQELNPVTDDWLSDFQALVAQKSNAPEYATLAGGLLALSTVAGDLVAFYPFFDDPIYLNLYVMLVGPSSTVRKTTVMRWAKKMYPPAPDGSLTYVQQPDDTSPQALNRLLGKAGELLQPVVLTQDEMSHTFLQMKQRHGYQVSLGKVLLTAYDHSAVDILRTKERIQAPRGAFMSLLGVSTPEALERSLDSYDFEKGLMARCLVFDLSDASKGKRISLLERQEEDAITEHANALRDEISRGVTQRRLNLLGQPEQGPDIMPISEDALERLDEFDALQEDITAKSTDEALAAMLTRAQVYVFKLAGLFAISRERNLSATVELQDVLRAIHLIETSLTDQVRLYERSGLGERSALIAYVASLFDTGGAYKSAGYIPVTPGKRGPIRDTFRGGLAEVLGILKADGTLQYTEERGWEKTRHAA